jgi:hypothetical protein
MELNYLPFITAEQCSLPRGCVVIKAGSPGAIAAASTPSSALPEFHDGQKPFVRRRICRARSERTLALHGQIRRSQPAWRHPGDCDVEKSIGRHRVQCRAGGPAGCHSNGGLLSRLAGVVAKLGKARRARNKSIARPQSASTAMRLIRTSDRQHRRCYQDSQMRQHGGSIWEADFQPATRT